MVMAGLVAGAEAGAVHHQQLQHQRGSMVQPALMVNVNAASNQRHISAMDCDMLPKKLRLSLCVGCGGQIHDQYILRVAPDLEWHAACLKCQECRQFLDESCTCFVRDGKTYCKRDYTRLFGTKCDKCGSSFSKNDFVMRAKTKIYHIDCFRCSACAKQLIPGDEFALREGGALYCKEDHEAGVERSGSGGGGAGRESNNNTTLSNNNHSGTAPELASMSDSGSESGSHKGGAGRSKGAGSASGGSGGDGKPTRVRTVLNEKQLHTLRTWYAANPRPDPLMKEQLVEMTNLSPRVISVWFQNKRCKDKKTCYAANPRPDALMKEQLVEMTSLSPRVIRVWFQNKRCKDKKKTIQMKLQMQQEKYLAQEGRKLGYGGMQGVALVAGSPVRHDSPLGLAPLEVTAYQPPWKALSDFALHTDLEQGGPPHGPAFQHLVNQMHGYDLGMHPQPPLHAPMMQDSLMHPDSADSYVTYLESDDSIPASP